jgi:lipid-A-disaccharide synthase
MRGYVDEVLAILPFEPAAFARLNGPPCHYVGHPLAERIGALRPSPEEARRRAADPPLVLVLPGSRRGEIRRFAATFGAAIALAAQRAGPFELVLPTLPHVAAQVAEATAAWPVRPRVVTEAAEKYAAFRSARAALAKSGTVTLELALAQVPTVAAYRIAAWEAPIYRRLVRVSSVILANLVIGENVVPELLQEEFLPEPIAAQLAPLIGDTPERRRQLAGFARLDAVMEIGGEPPSRKAARAVLKVAARGR